MSRPDMIFVPAAEPDDIPPLMTDPVRLTPADLAIHVQLSDHGGVAIWDAVSKAGHNRLHAYPPDEIVARTRSIQVYLFNGPAGEPAETYVGHLACGCPVQYAYRPAATAPCREHGLQFVRSVDYPAPAQEEHHDQQQAS